MSVYAGGGVIQTNQVTTTPFTIVYRAVDALGNVARPVLRSVSVYDPCSPERYCPDTDSVDQLDKQAEAQD
ncbi:hypothetical protein ABBQ38_002351 [Trebouxia sp. C0009 RCD-2024]